MALKKQAKQSGKSFNQVAVEALTKGTLPALENDDLDFMIGSMSAREGATLDAEFSVQRQIERKLWR